MDGQGLMLCPDGRQYMGEFANDMENGFGVETSIQEGKYDGEWVNGKKHGQGRLMDDEGDATKGIWENG